MIRTQIQLRPEQIKALKALSTKRKISMAELIRQSVDELIQQRNYISIDERRKRAIALAGKYHSKDDGANVSENHDDYLADYSQL